MKAKPTVILDPNYRTLDEIFTPKDLTHLHEIVEIKLRSALRPYRVLVNKLIEGYQEIADGEKDRFIETLPQVFENKPRKIMEGAHNNVH